MIKFRTEKRKISDLVPFPRNPRHITDEQKEHLKRSLEKFGLAEIPVINTDNTIIAGHQRLKILAEIGYDEEIDVRVPLRKLTEKEVEEYNIRSNANTGEWDYNLLQTFDIEDLKSWGIDFLNDIEPVSAFDPEEAEPTESAEDFYTAKVTYILSGDPEDFTGVCLDELQSLAKRYNLKLAKA